MGYQTGFLKITRLLTVFMFEWLYIMCEDNFDCICRGLNCNTNILLPSLKVGLPWDSNNLNVYGANACETTPWCQRVIRVIASDNEDLNCTTTMTSTHDIITPFSYLVTILCYQQWRPSVSWQTFINRSLEMHLVCMDSPTVKDYECWQQWLVINLDADRSDLVLDLRNKALKDCHNPFRKELHMKKENKQNHGDISRLIGKTGKTGG